MKINSDLIDGIIESGSNTNGNWIKFIDGTLLQYGIFTTDQYKFTVAYGSVYWSGSSVIINFPINFLTDTFPTVNASSFIPGGGLED